MVDANAQEQIRWPVDGHVHFHDVSRVAATLDAAAANFRGASRRCDGLLGGVLLAQAGGERVFEALQASLQAGTWKMKPVRDEPETLIATAGATSIAIVCGRQVRAEDGLEVLALGSTTIFEDGLPFRRAVETVQRSGALAAVPWGFGKWLGKRGALVEATLGRLGTEALFVGDNGGRLEILGRPDLMRDFETGGFKVLPGTDPFPIPRDYERVGSFGFFAELEICETAPWQSLRDWLLERRESPAPYGRACGPVRFMFNQVGIQLRRRKRGANQT